MEKRRFNGVLPRIVALLLAGLILFCAGCAGGKERPSGSGGGEEPTQTDQVELDEEIIVQATHIVEAEYIGPGDTENELAFEPVASLKGDLGDAGEIHVIPPADDPPGDGADTSAAYEKGETYLLFLERNISVYYPHDKYVPLGDLVISRNSASWEECRQSIRECLDNGGGGADIPYYGVPYTDSADIGTVVGFSANIFVVDVVSVYGENGADRTTAYTCAVVKTVRNVPVPDSGEHIVITFFDGTVEPGGRYLVLLGDAGETAPVYTLSSKAASVYAMEEAETIPEIQALLERAEEYPAG